MIHMEISCPECRAGLSIDAEDIDRQVKCSSCGHVFDPGQKHVKPGVPDARTRRRKRDDLDDDDYRRPRIDEEESQAFRDETRAIFDRAKEITYWPGWLLCFAGVLTFIVCVLDSIWLIAIASERHRLFDDIGAVPFGVVLTIGTLGIFSWQAGRWMHQIGVESIVTRANWINGFIAAAFLVAIVVQLLLGFDDRDGSTGFVLVTVAANLAGAVVNLASIVLSRRAMDHPDVQAAFQRRIESRYRGMS
jgi:predicted Zn finger-like uncharacterized protein